MKLGALVLASQVAWAPILGAAEIDKTIKSHKQELQKLESRLQTLEQERKKLKQDEAALSANLKKIEQEIEQSNKKQVKMKKQVLQNESQIKKLEGQVTLLTGEKSKWEQLVLNDIGVYYVKSVYPQRLSGSPRERYLLNALMDQKFQRLHVVEADKKETQKKEKKLLNYQKNLSDLKAQLEAEIQKQKKSKEEKSDLFKTTSGKRIAAEQEAERLKETAQSLENMIGKLMKRKEKERQKTLAAQKEAEIEKKDMAERRGQFPWPVQGTVVSSFGKQKRADLNISVINNGIRIKTDTGAAVKAVERGTVIFADEFRSYGQTVIVDCGGDVYTIYGLLGNILVQEGQKVEAGKVIGNAASDPGPQIYFEVRNDGHPENPMLWLK